VPGLPSTELSSLVSSESYELDDSDSVPVELELLTMKTLLLSWLGKRWKYGIRLRMETLLQEIQFNVTDIQSGKFTALGIL